jgi:hypothetical protein
MELKFETREAWLIGACEALAPLFQGEADIPEIRVSVSWPGGGSAHKRIGECWPTGKTDDGIAQVFISPMLVKPVAVLKTLVHEICHAIDDCQSGHKKGFIRWAKLVGLVPKWTSSTASPELMEKLIVIADELGEYPHAGLKLSAVVESKQSTRMLKVQCVESDYKIRMTSKWIEEVGTPICPCHDLAMDVQ